MIHSLDDSAFFYSAVQDDGSFEIPAVPAGRYVVQAGRASDAPDGYLKSIRAGDVEFEDGVLDTARTGDEPIGITLSARGGRVRGTVKSDPPFAGHVAVVLFPDDKDLSRRERGAREGAADPDGAFSIRGIPPGKYKLFAWPRLPEGAWQDPDFWREMEPQGIPVTIAEGDDRQLGLALISPEKTAALLTRLDIR